MDNLKRLDLIREEACRTSEERTENLNLGMPL